MITVTVSKGSDHKLFGMSQGRGWEARGFAASTIPLGGHLLERADDTHAGLQLLAKLPGTTCKFCVKRVPGIT